MQTKQNCTCGGLGCHGNACPSLPFLVHFHVSGRVPVSDGLADPPAAARILAGEVARPPVVVVEAADLGELPVGEVVHELGVVDAAVVVFVDLVEDLVDGLAVAQEAEFAQRAAQLLPRDVAVPVRVDLLKGPHHVLLCLHLAQRHRRPHELLQVDRPAPVHVQRVHEPLHLVLQILVRHPPVVEAGPELRHGDHAVLVGVQAGEDGGQALHLRRAEHLSHHARDHALQLAHLDEVLEAVDDLVRDGPLGGRAVLLHPRVLQHLVDGGALQRVQLQHHQHALLGALGDRGPGLELEVQRPLPVPHHLLQNLPVARPEEGGRPAQQDVQNHPGRPDVRLVPVGPPQHLRRDVVRAPHAVLELLLRRDEGRKTKVDGLDHRFVPLLGVGGPGWL
mmetsp:Transcript_11840/g.29977  ORF Transcript_11840/g.29977 Transcript_11840/m.29977 type:complete len:392 (+) Transcript_11840:473-1648(+)